MTPAWYVLRSRSWIARWVNLFHWPYSGWHLSYPMLGAGLTLGPDLVLLGWTVLAFFLGMGVGAHAFDILKGDPLRLALPRWQLHVAGALSIGLAGGIGLWQITLGNVSPWLTLAVAAGMVFASGYGLEWKGLHGDVQFALWWAVFPLLVGYLAQGIEWSWALVPAVAFAFLTATAQRVLSTRVRYLRRSVEHVEVRLRLNYSGSFNQFGRPWLLYPEEEALKLLSFAMPAVAIMMVIND